MHPLLQRQIAKAKGSDATLNLEKLLSAVSATYGEFEANRKRADRANQVMAEELGEMNAALERRRAEAEEANVAKGRFLANMSHEIRTPLNGVIALADALRNTVLTEKQREMVYLVHSSGETLERLLSDILDLSKIEAGKLELRIEPFDLQREIEAAAYLMRVRADDKGVKFGIHFSAAASGMFLGDAVRIRQIVSNFASNAVKFTSEGRVDILVSAEESPLDNQSARVTVEVCDTGAGFTPEVEARLFRRFEQGDSSITRSFGGTGLGLSICKALAEAMKGEVFARSTPGVGSRFTLVLTLPRSTSVACLDAPDRAEPDNAPKGPGRGAPQGPLNVLVVEDNPVNRRVIGLLLEPQGMKLAFACNGREGVDAWSAQSFDLVLMDMQMPELDGLAATRLIREMEAARQCSRTPIIMLSANAMAEHVEDAHAAGADAHVAKPFTAATLMEGVTRTLRAEPALRRRLAG